MSKDGILGQKVTFFCLSVFLSLYAINLHCVKEKSMAYFNNNKTLERHRCQVVTPCRESSPFSFLAPRSYLTNIPSKRILAGERGSPTPSHPHPSQCFWRTRFPTTGPQQSQCTPSAIFLLGLSSQTFFPTPHSPKPKPHRSLGPQLQVPPPRFKDTFPKPFLGLLVFLLWSECRQFLQGSCS